MARQINNIEKEFILTNLRDLRGAIEIHQGRLRIGCYIKRIDASHLLLKKYDSEQHRLDATATLVVFFRFRGQPMTFKTVLHAATDETLTIENPKSLYCELSRQFERIVSPEGISVSLIVNETVLRLSLQESKLYDPVEEPAFVSGFDGSNMQALLHAFTIHAKEYATESRIVMFRDRPPQTLPELLIARSGRMLLLPFLDPIQQKSNPLLNERLLTRSQTMDMLREMAIDGALPPRHLATSHELFCPVLFHQYVVAYLYLGKGIDDRLGFSTQVIEFVSQFAPVFSYSLKLNGYFHRFIETSRHVTSTEPIDISGSGIMLSYPTEPELSIDQEVDLIIRVEEQSLPTRGRIARKYRGRHRAYYGVRFDSLNFEDTQKLFLRLYGEQYRGEADTSGLVDRPDPEWNRYC